MIVISLKIRTFHAATLYLYNIGLRDRYDYTDAMFCDSLFSRHMPEIQSTKDIVCIKFNFGTRDFADEMRHIKALKLDDERKNELLERCTKNSDKYVKISKEELRKMFYENGVDIKYYNDEVIHYKMLYRNPSKAKTGQCMFIRAELYDKAHQWLTMGLRLPQEKAKIVELSAYAPLSTSTIEGVVHIPVNDVVILNDKDSLYKTMAEVVYSDGEQCHVITEERDVCNTVWDGMALIDIDSCPDWINGMCLLRNHFFKACAFKTRMQMFFKDYYGAEYDTATITDMFGNTHLVKDIKIITTDNAIKWKKFMDIMGDNPYAYWCDKVKADGEYWGIVKTDHTSKLGNVQQMSYQMVNTIPCTKDEVRDVVSTTVKYVELLKKDSDEYEKFLRKNATLVNHYEMLADLYHHYPTIANSDYFREEKWRIIQSYVTKLRSGKIIVEGDNLTTCGNPYALLLYSVGENWQADPTLCQETGVIQCYTRRFKDGEYLAGYRSPHNSSNNIIYLHNHYSPEMDKYFAFSQNIIAINNIGTDFQDRSNGSDFDSDFLFVTNQEVLVKSAKQCYEEYPTVVNEIAESGLTYNNTPEDFAKMDSNMAKAQRDIGESSNLAQIAVSLYWTELAKEKPDMQVARQLYENFVILAVIAQVAIDGIKRSYNIDTAKEIKRIRNMECMQSGHALPYFMKYTKTVKTSKNGRSLPYNEVKKERNKIKEKINYDIQCPMNYVQDWLNCIAKTPRTSADYIGYYITDIDELPKVNRRQGHKIKTIAEKYYKTCQLVAMDGYDEEVMLMEIQEIIDALKKYKISLHTMHYVIRATLEPKYRTKRKSKPGTTEIRSKEFLTLGNKLMNILYLSNKEKFLKCFTNYTRKSNKL